MSISDLCSGPLCEQETETKSDLTVIFYCSGCYFIGPRKGRFSESGKVVNFPGHSVPLTALGAFILILGFLAFNGGSQGSITEAGDADTVALAIVNTILGECDTVIPTTTLTLHRYYTVKL